MRTSRPSSAPWAAETSIAGRSAAALAASSSSKSAWSGQQLGREVVVDGDPGGLRHAAGDRAAHASAARARSVASSRASARRHRLGLLRLEPALQRRGGGRRHALAVRGQLVEPARDRRRPAPALELGQRGLERERQLQRRLALAALIEVQPRSQRELLARQRDVAPRQQRREALLRRAASSASPAAAAARAPAPSRRRRPARPSRSPRGSPAPAPPAPRSRRRRPPTAGARGSSG